MYMHKRLYICVYQRFAKVGCQWRTQTFCNKTRKKRSVKLVSQTIDYSYTVTKDHFLKIIIMALNGLHLFIHSHPTTPSKIRDSTEIYMELIM